MVSPFPCQTVLNPFLPLVLLLVFPAHGVVISASSPPASCTAVQTSRVVPALGVHPLIDVQLTGPGLLTNLTFTLEGTTDLEDIASLQVYFTGSVAEFRTVTLFGAVTRSYSGALSVSGSQELSAGVNHVWIAVEPRPGAKWGHILDGTLLSAGLNLEIRTPDAGAPPEYLTIGKALFSSILRKSGDDGVHTYRIPGLVTTPRGTLIAVFDLRWDSANDLPANIDVGCMRSTNLGSTWQWATETKTILDYDKNVSGSSGNGVGDPAVLVDRQTGTIWVAALWSYGNHGYGGSGAGLSTNQTGQYVLTRSQDDGRSWSPPINITAQAKANTNWGVCFQGPGHGIQLRDGTLLFPSQHTDPGGVNARAFFIFSTNHGATWLASPDVNPQIPPQLNENQMVELNSGQIMVSSRAPSGGNGKRVWSTYTRGSTLSDGIWSPLVHAVPDPVCQASFIRYSSILDGAARNRLLFANPGSSSSRADMTVRMSEDEGQTWTISRRIDTRPAAYSDLTLLADGTVGLLYETGDSGPYETLTFVRFHLDWLTQTRR
ncbi:MAG TPA: exo-alpha-sialidase [Candidatus Paceibacterota bacterium]|nr:exo-alpha-sialidase [Verrucomicrobiota bacterium]HRY50247.1 exo-alpha-sialidase [Candidatus Paceibacterota bacterium]HRZ99200.1 exo-alpha-sialidase [Candidatus Paceibacterota bacterium]